MTTITFDFHNTLASCDTWFDLEVRSLPWRVYELIAGNDPGGLDGFAKDDVDQTYRALRAEVIDHGMEIEAHSGVNETFRRLGIKRDARQVGDAVDELMRSALDDLTPVPGAVELVTQLHERGHRLGVISSAVHHSFITWALDRFGIASAFAAVISSASSGYYKSRPEIYQVALGRLGASPATTTHVGDSFRFDHLTARSAGLRTVWLADDSVETPEGPSPDLRIRTLIGATEAISTLAQADRT